MKYSGLSNAPDLSYTLRLYPLVPLAEISATVINSTGHAIEVQAIRAIESSRSIDLGGPESQDRVLSDSFSENRPAVRIHDLADATHQMHRGVQAASSFSTASRIAAFLLARFPPIAFLRFSACTWLAALPRLPSNLTKWTRRERPSWPSKIPCALHRRKIALS